MKTGNDGMECIEKQSTHSIPPLPHCAYSLAHCQSEWSYSWHTTNQRIQWLRGLTANLLRLCMLNQSRQRPRGSKSFQCSWTHRTYLFPTSSKSPQMLQTSKALASVFLPLNFKLRIECAQTLVIWYAPSTLVLWNVDQMCFVELYLHGRGPNYIKYISI